MARVFAKEVLNHIAVMDACFDRCPGLWNELAHQRVCCGLTVLSLGRRGLHHIPFGWAEDDTFCTQCLEQLQSKVNAQINHSVQPWETPDQINQAKKELFKAWCASERLPRGLPSV